MGPLSCFSFSAESHAEKMSDGTISLNNRLNHSSVRMSGMLT